MITKEIKTHTAAGIIPYFIENNELKFLLIKSSLGWEFPKGHLEEGETNQQAAIREAKEEAGLSFKSLHEGFRYESKYFIRKNYSTGEKLKTPEPKTVTYFMGQPNSKRVELSFEHNSYKWLFPSEAINKLFFSSKKRVLLEAINFLNNKYIFKDE